MQVDRAVAAQAEASAKARAAASASSASSELPPLRMGDDEAAEKAERAAEARAKAAEEAAAARAAKAEADKAADVIAAILSASVLSCTPPAFVLAFGGAGDALTGGASLASSTPEPGCSAADLSRVFSAWICASRAAFLAFIASMSTATASGATARP